MENKIIKNCRAATYGGIIEIMLFIVLFIAVITIIGVSMNATYEKNNDLTFGIVTNDTMNDLTEYQKTLDNSTKEGGMSFSSLGILQLLTLPKMINGIMSLTWSFVSGNFINAIVDAMNLGDYSFIVIVVFKLLYFIGLGLILLKILTKVVI